MQSALHLACGSGVHGLTREAIAEHAECSPALVSYYLGTMSQMRRSVVRAAVAREVLPVVAQALAMGDKVAQRAPAALKARALAALGEVT